MITHVKDLGTKVNVLKFQMELKRLMEEYECYITSESRIIASSLAINQEGETHKPEWEINFGNEINDQLEIDEL